MSLVSDETPLKLDKCVYNKKVHSSIHAQLHSIKVYTITEILAFKYCYVYGGTRDENNGFYFGLLDLLPPWLQILLITLKYSAIADLHTFQFTVAHALGFSIFTDRLLATDLNTETSISNLSEVFLSYLLTYLLTYSWS
jgi:hypothetical protein